MKQYWKETLLVIAITGILTPVLPIYSAIGAGILAVLIYWRLEPKKENTVAEDMLIEADGVIAEQEEVIRDYERLLDSLSTTLPCSCGGNFFEGLFQPGVENMVECEKCGSKYKVLVSFDSILMSDPLDLEKTQTEIIKKIENERDR